MEMTDKERAEKIRETLGDVCGMVELQQRVAKTTPCKVGDAVRRIEGAWRAV